MADDAAKQWRPDAAESQMTSATTASGNHVQLARHNPTALHQKPVGHWNARKFLASPPQTGIGRLCADLSGLSFTDPVSRCGDLIIGL